MDDDAQGPAVEPALDVAGAGDGIARRPRSRSRTASHRAPRSDKRRRKTPRWELPALVLLAILIAVVVKTFVVQPFYIPSESMEHTLYGCPGCHGDRILVNKPVYDFRDPHPGDIVVFDAPRGWHEAATHPPGNPLLRAVRGFGQLIGFVPPDGEVLVKRVIAVGGQTIKGDTRGTVMISNDGAAGPFRTLREPFVFTDPAKTQPAFGPVTVPKGRLWVMGDHRTDSADSRFHCSDNDAGGAPNCAHFAHQATVPISDVIGKAVVIAWPPSRWRTLGTPSTFTQVASAAGSALPGAVSASTVIPLFLLRRRNRKQPVCGRAGRAAPRAEEGTWPIVAAMTRPSAMSATTRCGESIAVSGSSLVARIPPAPSTTARASAISIPTNSSRRYRTRDSSTCRRSSACPSSPAEAWAGRSSARILAL